MHCEFTEGLVEELTRGVVHTITPTPHTPSPSHNVVYMTGECAGCGLPLQAAEVVGVYLLACSHRYHPYCFASMCAKRSTCVQTGCQQVVPDLAKSWVGMRHAEIKCKFFSFSEHIIISTNKIQLKVLSLRDYKKCNL